MCVIIIKQKANTISREVLENSARINPHGLGITFLDTFETTYHESEDYEQLLTERPFIAHFRYATVGAVGRANTHPFVCGEQSHELLMQNGTIKGIGTKEKCDSKVLAEKLGSMPRSQWKAELEQHDSRFVSINTRDKSFQIYNRDLYIKRDGIWYSKANVLMDNVVAVYGTLKRGHGNYMNYLRREKFVGAGVTQDKYPLIINGLPYLLSKKGIGHNVEVDVFKVTDATFKELDLLEGHPTWYRRTQVPIKMKDGRLINCWIYFNDTEHVPSEKFHKSFGTVPKKRVIVAPVPECNQSLLWDDIEEDTWPELKENNSPFCVECYNDLVAEEYPSGTYSCTGCGGEFTEEEVLRFNF